MLLWGRMQNFSKLAQLEILKNRRELRTTCEASDEDYHHPQDKNLGSKSQILQRHNFRTRRNFYTQ